MPHQVAVPGPGRRPTIGEEHAAPPRSSVRVVCTHAALLLLLASVPLAEQLAPVPAHARNRPASPAPSVVARVNGAAVGSEELDAALNALIPLSSYHQNVKPDKLQELRRQALDGLIDEELRYQDAVRLNVRVAPIEVELALDRARRTYGNADAFERARHEAGATLPQLRASILRALMIQKAYEQVVASRCRISDSDAADYYHANPARFVQPEQLRVSLITIGVDPSASRADWERARRAAQDAARRITAGTPFDTLLREYSKPESPMAPQSSLKSGDLGFVHRGQLIDEFERALAGARPGTVTPVIQTIYGFHLLRVAEIRPPVPKSFLDMKATIVRDLTETRCSQAGAEWSKRLRASARIEIVESRVAGGRFGG